MDDGLFSLSETCAGSGQKAAEIDYMVKCGICVPAKPIAEAGDRWDLDPWLLGVPNGVVDLRTGTLRPGDPGDRITLNTTVPYDPAARSDLWERTLRSIFESDETILYVQTALGSSCARRHHARRAAGGARPAPRGRRTSDAIGQVAGRVI